MINGPFRVGDCTREYMELVADTSLSAVRGARNQPDAWQAGHSISRDGTDLTSSETLFCALIVGTRGRVPT